MASLWIRGHIHQGVVGRSGVVVRPSATGGWRARTVPGMANVFLWASEVLAHRTVGRVCDSLPSDPFAQRVFCMWGTRRSHRRSRVAQLVAGCGWEGRTARRVAVGYGIGEDSVAPAGLRIPVRRGD